MFQNRSGQGGADGVMYRRAKLWQIIMVSTSAFIGMGFYSLIALQTIRQVSVMVLRQWQ